MGTGEIYHIINRGIEKRVIFTDKREYDRALLTLDYYRFTNLPMGLAHALNLELEERNELFSKVKNNERLVDILAFSLMPNHFHVLVKQLAENGIKEFISNFCNSYVRYFNTKNRRMGTLFQGVFRSVRIEDNEQLVHVSRYIHINPVVSYLVSKEDLATYPLTSFPEYLGAKGICNTQIILDRFSSIEQYKNFVYDQVDYQRKLELIYNQILE